MPACSLLGLGQAAISAFLQFTVTQGALDSFFLVRHLLLLHVEQCVSACAVRVFAVHTAPPFWSSSVR